MVLASNDPRSVVGVIRLSKAKYRKMRQNLAWAAGYNIVSIPLAAGALAWAGITLASAVGAILMSLSTIVVALNAQLLRRVQLRPNDTDEPRRHESGELCDDVADGMMTAEQLDMMPAMTGPEFGPMWLEMMVVSSEGATSHSEAVKAEGSNADVLALADQIITAGKAKSPKCELSSRAEHHYPVPSTPMSTASPSRPTFTAGASQFVPADLTGVQWPDGTVECRFRLTHPAGSLAAANGEVGVILTDPDAACTVCSDACAG